MNIFKQMIKGMFVAITGACGVSYDDGQTALSGAKNLFTLPVAAEGMRIFKPGKSSRSLGATAGRWPASGPAKAGGTTGTALIAPLGRRTGLIGRCS